MQFTMSDNRNTSIFDEDKREIFLVATSDNHRHCGMIITRVSSANMLPEDRRIALILSPHNHTTQALLNRQQFIIHLLAYDQADLVPTFGLYSSRDVDKFASVPYTLDRASNLPIVEGTCGWARASLISQMDAGYRLIVLAQIEHETAQSVRQSLLVQDLAQHLPTDTLQEIQRKYLQDVERDRQMRARMS
jgi:flavin reductase (DIM6/NTAB) family NADH-FMN oxidoreductase RutF